MVKFPLNKEQSDGTITGGKIPSGLSSIVQSSTSDSSSNDTSTEESRDSNDLEGGTSTVELDDFEDGNLNGWSGDTGNYSVTSNKPFSGNFSMENTSNSPSRIYSLVDDDNWASYPRPGDVIEFYTWLGANQHYVQFYWGQDLETSDYTAYKITLGFGEFALEIEDPNGVTTIDSNSTTPAKQTWWRVQINWYTNGDIYVICENQSNNNIITLNGNNTTYQSPADISWIAWDDTAYFDELKIK